MAGIFGAFKKQPEQKVERIPVNEVMSLRNQGLNNDQIINQLRSLGFKASEIRDALIQADVKSGVVPQAQTVNPPAPAEQQMEESAEISQAQQMPLPPEPKPAPIIPQQEPQRVEMIKGLSGPGGKIPEGYIFETPEAKNIPGAMRSGGLSAEETEALIEAIIEEKWELLRKETAEVNKKYENAMVIFQEIKNIIKSLEKRTEKIETDMQIQTDEYAKISEEVNAQLEAFSKVMKQIIPKLTQTVKDMRAKQ